MTLYEKVKLAAKQQGLSIHKLEVLAGVGNGVICKWKNSAPNVSTLQKVTDVLKMDIKEFV